MAYTYDDFLRAGTAAGMMDQFDESDMNIAQQHPEYGLSMLSLRKDLGNAKTDEQKLLVNEAINQMKTSYGYQAPQQQAQTPTAVAGVMQPQTQGSFNYDYESDPVYQAYAKQYRREGDRATANALGQAAAASAGLPSSYAVQAATQAGDYYSGQLADMIPQLEQNAYARNLEQQSAAANAMANSYGQIYDLITRAGYMPNEEELAAAGMNQQQADDLYAAYLYGNPDAAYAAGKIDPDQYYKITGKWPKGYKKPGSGGKTGNSEYLMNLNEALRRMENNGASTGYSNAIIDKEIRDGNITQKEGDSIRRGIDLKDPRYQ